MDPISIAAGTLGAEFLKEAVKFLWSEAGKILDRYHKRREKDDAANAVIDDPAPPQLDLPPRRTIGFQVVEQRREALEQSIKDLVLYANGLKPVDPSDTELLEKADELQRLVVEAYGIEAPELRISGRVRAGHIKKGGEAIGVEANVNAGDVQGEVVVENGIAGRAVGAIVKPH